MTASSPLRIIALAVLIVISTLVHAPQHYSAVAYGSMEAGAEGFCRATGIDSTDQAASPATAGNAALQCAFPEEGIFLAAFDTQEEYCSRAIGIHNAEQMLSFANTALQPEFLNDSDGMAHRDTQARDHIRTHAFNNAGQMASTAHSTGNPQQHAPFHDSSGITNIAQQGKHNNLPSDSTEAGRLLNIASAVESDGLDPLLNRGMAYPDNQGNDFSPVPGLPNAIAVIAGAKTGEVVGRNPFIDGSNKPDVSDFIEPPDWRIEPTLDPLPNSGGGMAYPDNQGNNPSPAIGLPNAIAMVPETIIGKEGGRDPFIYGSDKPDMSDLISPPDWRTEPTADGNNAGNSPAAKCHSNSPCDALLSKANNSVPEPSSLALLGLGIIGVVLSRRRKAAIARQ